MATKNETTKEIFEDTLGNIDLKERVVRKRDHKTYQVKTLLSMMSAKEPSLTLPSCQRLYVWSAAKRKLLLESVLSDQPISNILLATKEGSDLLYLVDGQQRLLSLALILADKKETTADEKAAIKNYKIHADIIYDITEEEMQDMFDKCNSGERVASVVKQRTKLLPEIRNLVLDLSSSEFFKNVGFNVTASKGHHHETITENALLAAAEVPIGSMRTKDLRERLNKHSVVVLDNVDKAKALLSRLEEIFDDKKLMDKSRKSALNNNFMGTIVYIMAKYPDIDNNEYVKLINYVFEKRKSVPEYSRTASSGAASAANCMQRLTVLAGFLNDKPYNVIKTSSSDVGYETFLTNNTGTEVYSSDGTIGVMFDTFSDKEKYDLYDTSVNNFTADWDAIIKSKFDELSQVDNAAASNE